MKSGRSHVYEIRNIEILRLSCSYTGNRSKDPRREKIVKEVRGLA
jgi:hypothetical protein